MPVYVAHRRLVLPSLVYLNILNLLDIITTLYLVSKTETRNEINPFMRTALEVHPVFFIAVKLAIMLTVSFVIWRIRHYRYIYSSLGIITCIYTLIVISNLLGCLIVS